MKQRLIGLALLLVAVACMKEQGTDRTERAVRCHFNIKTTPGWVTKSTLSSADVEDRITNLTIGIYRDGELFAKTYYEAPLPELDFTLYKGQLFKVYAMANMGDQSERLPKEEAALETFSWRLTSYRGALGEDVNSVGMPMAGTISVQPGESEDRCIRLQRLLSKVTVHLSCTWPGGRIAGARLCNMNARLLPFGISAIREPVDVYTGTPEEENVLGEGREEALVLYVPENRQGCIEGISSALEKSHEANAEVDSRKRCLTYLEVEVEGSGLYEGRMTYRNYLGNNATDSFEIERNKAYVWKIEYSENNLSRDEWKYGNELEDNRTLEVQSPVYVQPGASVVFGDYVTSNIPKSALTWRPIPPGTGETGIFSWMDTSFPMDAPGIRIRTDAVSGQRMSFLIEPLANRNSEIRKTMVMIVREPLKAGFVQVPPERTYPYQYVRFQSTARYSYTEAQGLRETLSLNYSGDGIRREFESVELRSDAGGYYLVIQTVPSIPGTYTCTASCERGEESFSFTVSEPRLTVDVTDVHLDVRGNLAYFTWKLCDEYGNALPDPLYAGDCRFNYTLEDPYGTDIFLEKSTSGPTGYLTTVQPYRAMLRGFGGLAGLDTENYSFHGLTVPVKAAFSYQNGYTVENALSVTVDNPLEQLDEYDGVLYEYRVDMGLGSTKSYISVSPSCTPENMLDWPQRTFTIDLTRGGTRAIPESTDVWKGRCASLDMTRYLQDGRYQTRYDCNDGKVRFTEELGQWGPLYYGKRISNMFSGEELVLAHSVIRIYNHYNVFACFDVQQDKSASMQESWGSMDWEYNVFGSSWGCFRATTKNTFSKGPYASYLNELVGKNSLAGKDPAPVFNGFHKEDDHLYGNASDYHYRTNGISGYRGYGYYYLGYWDDSPGYNIYYRVAEFSDNDLLYFFWPILNWRVVAAANVPQFRIETTGFGDAYYYCTPPVKLQPGTYNFSIMLNQDYLAHKEADYLDPEGHGYQYVHPFWEGREGKCKITSRRLNGFHRPLSRLNVTLVNGWYDPSLYYNPADASKDGVPAAGLQTGMYFFDEACPYYDSDHPFNFQQFDGGNMNCMQERSGVIKSYEPLPAYQNTLEWFNFGTLQERDRNAAR